MEIFTGLFTSPPISSSKASSSMSGMPPWFRTLRTVVSLETPKEVRDRYAQMPFVASEFAFYELGTRRLTVVRKVE